MVKIPELAEDGQNWKIYRAKYLEVAATENLLSVVAGWELDDGSKDWDHWNRVARMLLYITLPPLLQSRIRLLERAQEVFRYLAYYFLDADPIVDPRAKKLATCANEDKCDPSAESPTSENAATGAEREDPPTKALNRGTKDIDDGNVGRTEDPRTSLEASSKGNSAESAGTLVLLESEPHETQNVPQNSLPLTLRLPIDGKPGECKQEAADGVVTAERTNRTVETAKSNEMDADIDRTATLGREPAKVACGVDEGTETIADVDRTALLGGEPAEMVCGVDEGDKTERKDLRLQKSRQYCQENCQRNGNARGNVPSAHGLPLEGEWTASASGQTNDPKSIENASNAAVERADGSYERLGLVNVDGVESEGCEGGTDGRVSADKAGTDVQTPVECCQQLCLADGDPGGEVERVDAPNELTQLLTTTIASYVNDGDANACVHLGGMSPCAGDTNGVGRGTDVLRSQTDASNASNDAETDGISHGEGAGTYLGARGAKRVVHATDGVGSQSDASSGHRDVPSVDTDAINTAYATQNVSIPRKREKTPDSPMEPAKCAPDESNGLRDHAGT